MRSVVMIGAIGLGVGFAVGGGCTTLLGGHCANLSGDRTCAELGAGSFCSTCTAVNDGCTDTRPLADCYFAGAGGESSTSDGGATSGTSTSAVDGSMTSEESSTTGSMPCTEHEGECTDPAAPFCGTTGSCGTCEMTDDPDGACASLGTMAPLCIEGACVACTAEQPEACDQQLLLCDAATNACVSCTEHDQCSSGACDIFVGTCFDPATVVEVGGVGQPDTIGEGLVALEALWPDVLGERRGVLVLAGGTYDETATVQAGSLVETDADAVAFIAAAGASPSWINSTVTPGSPTLTVIGMTTRAYLDGVLLRNNAAGDVMMVNNGWGLRCNDARVDIRRSQVVANNGGSIQALGQCELHLANSFVGGDVSDRYALSVVGGDVTARIVYSTLGAGFGVAAALRCDGGSSVEVRNSLLVARTAEPEVDCIGAQVTTSATEAGGLGNMNTNWFADYAAGDFHLAMPAPAGIRVAQWQPGDPPVDIDGDRRVTNGELDHAGADVP
jgi:hypothetical protein